MKEEPGKLRLMHQIRIVEGIHLCARHEQQGKVLPIIFVQEQTPSPSTSYCVLLLYVVNALGETNMEGIILSTK